MVGEQWLVTSHISRQKYNKHPFFHNFVMHPIRSTKLTGRGRVFVIRIWRRVRQLHHVVKAPGGIIAPNVVKRQLAGMRAGDGFEAADALELALEWAVVGEGRAVDNLHRPQRASGQTAREPDFALRSGADGTEQ